MALTGLSVNAVLADLPSTPQSIKVMDTNKNGRVEKQENLAYMGNAFDNLAGSKGYCTFAEIKSGTRDMNYQFETAVD